MVHRSRTWTMICLLSAYLPAYSATSELEVPVCAEARAECLGEIEGANPRPSVWMKEPGIAPHVPYSRLPGSLRAAVSEVQELLRARDYDGIVDRLAPELQPRRDEIRESLVEAHDNPRAMCLEPLVAIDPQEGDGKIVVVLRGIFSYEHSCTEGMMSLTMEISAGRWYIAAGLWAEPN